MNSTIFQARADCKAKGGHLASIQSEDDQNCLLKYTAAANQNMWIGLHEKRVGLAYSWVWETENDMTTASSYVNWAPGMAFE